MKILMFGWEFPPHITGGLGTACYGLTKGLSKFDVEIIFVVPKAYGDEDKQYVSLKEAGEVIITEQKNEYSQFWKNFTYMEIGAQLIPYMSPEEFQKIFEDKIFSHSELKQAVFSEKFKFTGQYGIDLYQEVARYALIASYLAANKDFDIIHAHDWLTYPAGMAAKEVSGKPLVVHMHATEFDRSGEHINQRVYDIERAGMEAADKVITVSNLTRNIVINRYGIHPDKVTTVYNSVEPMTLPDEFRVTKGFKEKIVTFLGRVTFQKGPDYFVEAAKKILDKDTNVRFVMAGSGDMLHRMIKRVAQLGIATKFHFAGFLKGQEVYDMFSISDVYVMPSVSEPFGISPLEAMMSDVPVIISKQSGVSEILRYALKVDFWDVDDLADAIYGILHYDGLAEMFKHCGKQEVENLKWENSAYKVKEIYKSFL
ncbi:MAG: glycosyltransferase family 4 protein [Bacteroidales bacterium]|jgi:glycosyltransferase involved in cell wall biosynthesis|nr:glycosyltransferase family 4 protein [Bacteroidales bacterium]